MTANDDGPRAAPITIHDVAREAGVSISTVSHVFTGHRPTSETTQARVRAAAEALGYVANPLAQQLVALGRRRDPAGGATIRDVAREAEVSVSTVSHAQSGKRPVAARTRERVLAAVERLGYVPNPLGQRLAAFRRGDPPAPESPAG